jgi:hypothetical protein
MRIARARAGLGGLESLQELVTAKRTIVAAFKAAGMRSTLADQLFKGRR